MRELSPSTLRRLAFESFAALGGMSVLGFPFAFNPGWANGWPGGLTIHVVWPAGMTLYGLALMAAAGTCLGSLVTLLLGHIPPLKRRSRAVLATWLVGWAGWMALTAVSVFRSLHAEALAAWPNGYPAGGL